MFFFLFGIYLSSKIRNLDHKNKLYRLTSIAVLAASSLAFWEYEISKVRDIDTMLKYGEIHALIITITIYLCILSVWNFMNSIQNKKFSKVDSIILLIYSIPTCAILYGLTFTDKSILEGVHFNNGLWTYQLKSELDWLTTSYFSFFTFSFIALNFSFWNYRNKKGSKKSRLRSQFILFFIFTVSVSMFFLFLYNGEIQQHGYYIISPAIIICCIGLGWTFSNYKLFELSPISAMDNIMDSVSNLITITDNDLNIKYMNRIAREEFGIGDRSISGLTVQELIKTTSLKDANQDIKQVTNLKKDEKIQTNFSIKSGDKKSFFSLTFSPIFDDQNNRVGNISIGTNITAIKKAEFNLKDYNTKLEQSNEELERFAYIASHDLKTPLRNVVSFLSLIERKVEKYDDKDLSEFIQIANNSASQMYHLIQDVLEYSQVNNYDKKNLKVVDLNEVISSISQILQPIIKEKNCCIFADQLPVVMGDRIRLSQLFQNLIENGCKYNNSESPTVFITHQKTNTHHIFHIKDNGIGIDEKYQSRIFEMFKRLHTYAEYEGTGIGLAICKKIVNSYEGDISIRSEAGIGSTFKISLKLEEVKLGSKTESLSIAEPTNLD